MWVINDWKILFFYVKKTEKNVIMVLWWERYVRPTKQKRVELSHQAKKKKKKKNDKECHWPIKALFWSMTLKIKKKNHKHSASKPKSKYATI